MVMAVGLVVDYVSHVLHYYLRQSHTLTPDERMVTAMTEIGPSVLLGCTTSLLGMSPLIFANSTIFRTFFRMFLSIIIYGALHGLVLLPALMPLIPFTNLNNYIIKDNNSDGSDSNRGNMLDSKLYKGVDGHMDGGGSGSGVGSSSGSGENKHTCDENANGKPETEAHLELELELGTHAQVGVQPQSIIYTKIGDNYGDGNGMDDGDRMVNNRDIGVDRDNDNMNGNNNVNMNVKDTVIKNSVAVVVIANSSTNGNGNGSNSGVTLL